MRGILAIVIALVAMAPLVYAIDVSTNCDSEGCILAGGCVDTRPPLPSSIFNKTIIAKGFEFYVSLSYFDPILPRILVPW